MTKQLYRSRRDAILGGVSAGLAKYLDTDPNLIRLAWVILGLMGVGIVAYPIAWIIIPEEPASAVGNYPDPGKMPNAVGGEGDVPTTPWRPEDDAHREEVSARRRRILGLGLIVVGALFFIREVAPRFIHSEFIWAIALIALGVLILSKRDRGGK